HPDYPGATYEELRENLDPDRPTIGVWFYESHWTNENSRYVDALVRAIEAHGANALPVFCDPVADEPGRRDAEWIARNWFAGGASEDSSADAAEPVVDAVVSGFVFALSMEERGRGADDEGETPERHFLEELGVPVLGVATTTRSREAYRQADAGLKGFELALSVALPEFDGVVVTHPVSGKEPVPGGPDVGTAPEQHRPIEDRVDHVARLAINWARLRHRPNEDKRVAVVLHNYPPSDDGIGTAFGLDTPASLVALLDELADRGYAVGDYPDDGDAVIESLVEQLTLDGRWVAPGDARERSVDVVEPGQYAEWFEGLDPEFREAVLEEWGDPPERPIAVPGVEFGNVLVTVQPPRGFAVDPSKVYHDSALQPPHEYVAVYRWLREAYGADAVVHLGTHGSLEWLPGKTVGLDAASAPDALVDDLPNVYPYVINNPGEGAQAKRRSYAAVVDHLTPVLREAGTYDDLADLEELVRTFREAGRGGTPDTGGAEDATRLGETLRERVRDLDLAPELGIDDLDAIDDENLSERLHEYLTDLKTTQVRMGLHTLGKPPEEERLVHYLAALTRLPNPGAPSLRESVAGVLGVEYDRLVESPGAYNETVDGYLADVADVVTETSRELLATLAERDFAVDDEFVDDLVASVDPLGDAEPVPGARDDLRNVLRFVCEEAVPRVRGATTEVPRVADALAGEYVPPGGSGAPTRGGVDLLPTGRNFYTLDPRKVPARSAWRVGREVAESLLERHREKAGEYPESVGVVAWGTPTVRTRGETVAQALALLGVEPVWSEAGRVEGAEPIPLDELGRPRIDVTTRVSGLFRDALPQAAAVIDEAVSTVADLDEPHDRNFVKKHVDRDADRRRREDGLDPDAAREAATRRVFTTRPGGYGAGTNKAVTEGNWEDRSDLAEAYLQWGGYAMDADGPVEQARDAFEQRLADVDATVKLEDTAEQDEFDSSDWYAFHGGLRAAVEECAGEAPASYVGDATDPDRTTVYTNAEKVRKTMRTRVLNPDWLDSMDDHGYKGAGDLATTVQIALGWDATAGVVGDALWEDVADAYAFDEERQDWLRDVNPWALESIADTLLEAIDRDLWEADEETRDRLRDLRLEVEGDLEARASADGPGSESR
ncbi:MAG: cobaltochelatase CobN, partial [Halobacteriales archaeon]